jgi:serine/threonine protein kinase
MNTKIDADLTGEIIFKKYKTLQKIGKGAFGQVYRVQNIITKEIFAMKTELIS